MSHLFSVVSATHQYEHTKKTQYFHTVTEILNKIQNFGTKSSACEAHSSASGSYVTVTVTYVTVAFILTDNETWTECCFLNNISLYLFQLTDSLLSNALSAHWSAVPRQPGLPACHHRTTHPDRVRTAGESRVFLQGGWDASSWSAEVWSSPRGKASCVSKHHNNPAETHAPWVGEFSAVPEQCPTLLRDWIL